MTTIKRTTESRSRRKKSFRARCNRPLEPETYSGSCRNTEQTFFRIVRNKGAGAGPFCSPELTFWGQVARAAFAVFACVRVCPGFEDLSPSPTGNVYLPAQRMP